MNRTQIAEIILNHNPVLNIQTADGNSPLHLAIEYQNPVILERLLQAGADPLIPNSNNQSPYSMLANADGEISASWIPISVKELFIMKATAKEAKSVIGPPKKSFAESPADDAIQQSPKLIEEAVVEETAVEQFVNFQTESFAQRTESRKSVTAVTTPSANIFGAVERDSDSSISEDILSGNTDSLTDNSELLKSFGFTKADITTRINTSSSDSSVSTDSDASSLSENEGQKAGVAVISQQKEDQAVASEILDTVSELYKETLLNPKGNQANAISGSSNHTSNFALSSDLSSALVSIADLSSDDDNFDVSSISLSDSNDDNNISSVPKTAVSETAVKISKKPILASTQKHTSVLNFDSVPKTYIDDIEENNILEPVVATRKSVESSENDSIISFDSDDNLPIINSTTTVMKQSNTIIPEIKISTEDQTTVVKINTNFSTETSLLKLQTNKSPLQPIPKHTDIPDVQKKNQNEPQLPSKIFPLSKRSGSVLSLQSSNSTDMKQPKSPLQSDVSDLLQTLESVKNSLKVSQPTTPTETTSQTTKITQFIQKSRDLYEELEWRSIYLRDVVISLQDHFSDAKVNYDGDADVDQILENLTGAVVHWKTDQSLKLEEKNKEVIQLKQKFDEVSKEFEVKIAELNKDIALKDSVIVDLNSKLVGHLEGSETDSSTESEDSKDVIIEKYEQEIKLLAQHIEDSKIATQERDEEHKKVLDSLSELEENMKELKNVCRDDQNAVRQLEVEKLALFQECGGLKLKLLEAEERVANLEKKIKVQPETDKTEKEIFALQQEPSHSNKKSKELEESIHTISAELEEAVKSKEMLQNNLKSLTDSNTLLTTEKKTLSNTIKAISTENKSLKQLISEKNEEINLLHTENLINTALSRESVAAIGKMKTSSQEDLRNSNERIQELLDLIQKHENEKKELEVKFANEKELWNATINEERTNNQKQLELEKSQYLAYVSKCLEDIPLALSESDTKISKICSDLHNWYKIVQNLRNHIQSTESNFPGELRKFGEELIVYVLTRVSSFFNVEETLAELAQIGSEMEQTLTSKQKQEEEITQLRNELKSKAELIEHMQSHISQIDAPENSANEARIIELESEFELKTNQLKDLQRDLLLAKTEIDILKKDKKEATDALEKELRTHSKEIKRLQATTKQTDLNNRKYLKNQQTTFVDFSSIY
ncbi:hypothetical protein HK098_007163 [Nowakowskiella sp. JEL0407]|nr:hypothetical protein HK098_007163 [Nowakowskiella sp. JEL0407]